MTRIFTLCLVFCVISVVSALGANRFWISSTASNWNNTANWSTASGGAGGASVPGAADVAIFDGAGGRNGKCTLDIAPSVGGMTVNGFTGTIDLAGFTITVAGTGTYTTGTITNTGAAASVALNATTVTFNGTTFSANISGSSAAILFSGSTFNNPVNVTKTGVSTDAGTGNNTFNSTLNLQHSSTGTLRMSTTTADTFNGDVTFTINSTGGIYPAYTVAGTQFKGNISIVYNSTGPIVFGSNGGSSSLASAKTISVSSPGASGSGNLTLSRFTQLGATAQTIQLNTNPTATLTIGPSSTFNGDLTASAPSLVLQTSTFQGVTTLTKLVEGTNNDNVRGGNTFNGTFTANSQSSADIYFGGVAGDAGDTWNAAATFNSTGGGRIRVATSTSGNVFNSTAAFNVTAVSNVASRIQISRFSPGQATFNGAVTLNNSGNASDIQVSYDPGTSTTFNGPVTAISNTNTASGTFYIGFQGTVAINNNITFNSTCSDNIQLAGNSGTVTLGNGFNMSIGGSGFATGTLTFRNFTQTGSTAQNLTLTGTASLIFSSGTTFNGNVNFVAPTVQLNGATFNGTAYIEKSGATSDNSAGGNIFNGTTTIVNSGSGYLLLGNGTRDQFNASTTFNNTGSYRIYFGHNHPGQTTTFATDVTLNANKSGGADAWSYLIGDGGASNFTFGGTFTLNVNGAIQSNCRILNGGGNATYSSTTTVNLTNTSSATQLQMGTNGVSTYNGNIVVTNTNAATGIYFNLNSGASSTLAAGNTITIGAGGYTGGALSLVRFTQSGATPQTLTTFTGAASLILGPTSSFGGNVNFIAPSVLLNGTTFSGTAYIEKTGSTGDFSTGGNVFNGAASINNSGTNYIVLGNTNRDQFNSTTTMNITNGGQINFAQNHSGQTTTFTGDVILNATKTAGSIWSYAWGEGAGTAVSFAGNLTININGSVQSNIRTLNGSGSTATYAGTFTLNSTNTSASTQYLIDNIGAGSYNGNIVLSNSGTINGTYFANNAGASATLANGMTITIGAGGYVSGLLSLARFTQVGSTAQALTTFSGPAALYIGPSSSFGGNVNFIAPQIYLQGCTYNGTAYIEKTGATNNLSNGGNTFNSTATLVDSGSGYLATGQNSPDIFNGDLAVNNTGSNAMYFANNTTGTQFNGNLTVSQANPGTGIYIGNGANSGSTMAAGKTVFIGAGGYSAGLLYLQRFTQNGSAAMNLTLTGTAAIIMGPSSSIGGNFTVVSPTVLLNGCIYNGTADITKNGSTNDTGNGANTFSSTTSITNSGSGFLRTANVTADIFNGDLTITNSGSNAVYMAHAGAGNQFNGNLIFNGTGGLGIYFSTGGGSGTLATGKTVSVGGLGFSTGTLQLTNFTQVGSTAQSLTFTGTGILTLGSNSTFNGNATFSTPQLYLNGTTFNGTASLQKTGATNNTGNGNNIFNSTASITNAGSGVLRTNGGNTFNGATTLANSGTADLLLELVSGSTYNGDVTITNSGSSSVRMGYTGATAFNGNISVNSTSGGGVFFGESATAAVSLANTKTISVGGTGFTSGTLWLTHFTQVGGTAQTLTLTSNGVLTVGPSSTFNGAVTFTTPTINLNGCTYNSTASITKTGTTNDTSQGGNIFNSTTSFTNSGLGQFINAGSGLDTFNGDLTLTNSNLSAIYMSQTTSGTQFNGNIIVNSTNGVGIYFGNNGGASTLAAGKTISIGGGGFAIGELRLYRFTQSGATAQSLTLTGTASLRIGNSSVFNGDVTFVAPQLYLDGATYNGVTSLTKNGASNNTGTGNNVFASTTTITNASSSSGQLRTNGNNTFNGTTSVINNAPADLLLELTSGSTYNGDVTFTNTGASYVRVGYIGGNSFNGNIIVNSTNGTGVYFCENAAGTATLASGKTITVGGTGFSLGSLVLQRFTQSGATAQSISLTGTAAFQTGPSSTWNGNLTVSSPQVFLNGATFNGTNSFTKTGTTTDASTGGNTFNGTTSFTNSNIGIFRLSNTTGDAYNAPVTFTQSSGTIQPAYNATSTFASDVTVNSSSAMVFGAAASGVASFNGSGGTQNISITGSAVPTFNRLAMNASSGGTVNLNTIINIGVTATFTTGVMTTSSSNYLNFASGSTTSGASNNSYVDGPVRKTGNQAFTFPVGTGGVYRSIGISAPGAATDAFTAQFFRAAQAFGNQSTYSLPIIIVSSCEYWVLNRTVGASNVNVTLSWNSPDCTGPYITDITKLLVARWNLTNWVSHGNGGTTGNATTGTVTTSAAVTSFSPFALASSSFANPLPITLNYFKASLIDGVAQLSWETESEINNDFYTLERSSDGVNFDKMTTVKGAGTKHSISDYGYTDESPLAGISYYRLKQTDFDKTERVVGIATIENKGGFAVYPNPISSADPLHTNFSGAAQIFNGVGQVVLEVSNASSINIQSLSPGFYIVRAANGQSGRLIVK